MNTFMKKSSYLFLASTILASTVATSVGVTGGVVAKADDGRQSENEQVNSKLLNESIATVKETLKDIEKWKVENIKKSTIPKEPTDYENARATIDELIEQFKGLSEVEQLKVTNYDQLAMANIKLQRLEHAKMVGIATYIFENCNLPDYQDDGITAEWTDELEENIQDAVALAEDVPDNQQEQFKKIKLFKNDPGLGENLEKLNNALVNKKYDWVNETNEENIVEKIISLDENITIYEKVMAIKKYNDLSESLRSDLTARIKDYTNEVAVFIDKKANKVGLINYGHSNVNTAYKTFNYGNYHAYKLMKLYANEIDVNNISDATIKNNIANFKNNISAFDMQANSLMDKGAYIFLNEDFDPYYLIFLNKQFFISLDTKKIEWSIEDLMRIKDLIEEKGNLETDNLNKNTVFQKNNLPLPDWEGISYTADNYEDVASYVKNVADYILLIEDLKLDDSNTENITKNILEADNLYKEIITNNNFTEYSNVYIEALSDYTFKLNMLRTKVLTNASDKNDGNLKPIRNNIKMYAGFESLLPEDQFPDSLTNEKIETFNAALNQFPDDLSGVQNEKLSVKTLLEDLKKSYKNLFKSELEEVDQAHLEKYNNIILLAKLKKLKDDIDNTPKKVSNYVKLSGLLDEYNGLTTEQKNLIDLTDSIKKEIANLKSLYEFESTVLEAFPVNTTLNIELFESQKDIWRSVIKTYNAYAPEQQALFSAEFQERMKDLITNINGFDYEKVIDAINAISQDINVSNINSEYINKVRSARELYTKLKSSVKKSVDNFTLLENAEGKIVAKAINDLPELLTIKESDIDDLTTKVNEINMKYNSLSANGKQVVTNIGDLEEVTAYLQEREIIKLQDQIKQLPTVSAATINDYKTIQDISEQYEQLGDNKAKLTDVHQLTDLQFILPTLKKAYEASQAIEQLPSADTITVEYENAVGAANKQLNDLTDAEVDYVPDAQKEKLNALVTKIKEQVQALINNLPSDITLEHESQVRQVRAAYDNLGGLNSELSITKLTEAELELAKLKDEQTIVQSIQKAIDQLPDLTSLTLAHENAVKTIVENYEQLSGTQQATITNYSKVTLAQEKLNMLKENDKPIQAVIAQIQQLPSANALTLADESKVTEARQAYNNLSSAQRASVTNADKLDVLEEKITLLKQAQAMPVEAVIALIQKIPTTITLDDQAKIEEARERYNDLTATQQQVVTNYAALQKAESTLASLIKASNEKIIAVQTLISNLPTSSKITVWDKEVIEAAREAYNALSLTEQQLVTNYTTLQKAEAALKNVSTDEEKEVEQDPEVLAVEKAIHALPTYSKFTIKDANALINARDLYDKLTRLQQAIVSNYETLLVLEDKLDMLQKAEEEKEDAKTETPSETEKPSSTTDFSNLTGSTKTVAQLINTLPSVDKITLDNGAVLNATYKAFSALSKAEQEKIPNAFTLVIAKAIYDDLQLEEDQKAAKKEIAKIASLPTVSLVDLSDEAAIAEAKAAYAQLDVNQKALVTNYATITQLETQIASLKTAALNVQQTISALPSASLITENNRSAIETARAKYTALTTSQKKLVKNVALLDAAEQKLAENQTETVKKLINTINEWPNDITLNEESAIQEARKTYNALPSLQQKAITNYAALLNAETQLAALLNTDRAIAEVVDAMINDLPFTITAKDQAAVEQARKAYRALTASQKLYVTNISVLDKAEATLLAAADNDLKAAKAVVTAIDSLPNEQVVTIEDADNVVAVRDAYRQLTTTQKGYVDNYDTLKAIEAAMTKVEAREKALKAADVEIDIPTVKNTTKTIEGYVTPGAKVAVYIGSKKIATATVDTDGYYTINISRQQAGTELKFIVFNEIGDKLLREYVKVKAATVTAASSLKASPTKISGKAPKNKTVTIYKGSKKLKTTKSTANGKFSVKLPKQAKGTTLKVIVSDSVGNKSKSKTVKVK